MGVFVNLPIEPGEEGKKTAAAILETVAAFCEKAGFDDSNVFTVSAYLDDYNPKIYYDIRYQIPGEGSQEPDYESVRVKFYKAGGWKIEPHSFNPPKYPFGGKIEPPRDMRTDWENQVVILLAALQYLYAYIAEVQQEEANNFRSQATKTRRQARTLKARVAKIAKSNIEVIKVSADPEPLAQYLAEVKDISSEEN